MFKRKNVEETVTESTDHKSRSEIRHEKAEAKREQASRNIILYYLGGHPKLTKAGLVYITRSEDGKTLDITVNKQTATINTCDITDLELIEQSETITKHKSGLGGAIVGDLIAGPAGAFIGTVATRKNQSKIVPKDRVVVTIKQNDSTYKILLTNRSVPAVKWYAKASAILSSYS